jgi:hypothetical protein
MTDARDRGLQALFDAAREMTADEPFIAEVMADIDRLRRRTIIGWIVAGLLLASLAWWLSVPLMSTIDLASQLLPDALITVEGEWVGQLLAPINSVAGVLGLVFLGTWITYRKIST